MSPFGDAVAAIDARGEARLVPCEVCRPVDELLATAGRRATRSLTPPERERYLHE